MKAYLAGGWFSPEQAAALEECRVKLAEAQIDFYDPQHMCVCPPDASDDFASYVLAENCKQILASDFVYASIAGRDLGTSWEIGYAIAMGKAVHVHVSEAASPQHREDAIAVLSTDFSSVIGQDSVFVCDTTGKNVLNVACAGFAYGKGKPVLYYAPSLPKGAQFNLMLAKSGAAVCTDEQDLAYCLDMLCQSNGKWLRQYTGLIE